MLLPLCENGIVPETKFGMPREARLATRVCEAANNPRCVPEEVRSRFLVLKFRRYSPERYGTAVKRILVKREGVQAELAELCRGKGQQRA